MITTESTTVECTSCASGFIGNGILCEGMYTILVVSEIFDGKLTQVMHGSPFLFLSLMYYAGYALLMW